MAAETISTPIKSRELITGSDAELKARKVIAAAMAEPITDCDFIDEGYLGRLVDQNAVSVTIRLENPIDVPLAFIKGAAGFTSWEEGRGHVKFDSDRGNSVALMKEYASRHTSIPPLEGGLMAYIMPDGRMFGITQNAHRTGAAIMRGDETVSILGDITVQQLKEMPLEFRLDEILGPAK